MIARATRRLIRFALMAAIPWAHADMIPVPVPSLDTMRANGIRGASNLNSWHGLISTTLIDRVDQVDRFFADERLNEDTSESRLTVSQGLRYDKRNNATLNSDVRLRAAFPYLQNRLQLILDDTLDVENPDDTASFTEAQNKSQPDLALRYILSPNERRRLHTDAGVRLGDTPQAFARVRGRILIPLKSWELRLNQTVAWFTDDGWTETSEMRWSRPLPWAFLFQSSSRVKWEENEPNVTPSQSLSLSKRMTLRDAVRLSTSGVWPATPEVETAKYNLDTTYRRRLFSYWLFMNLSGGVDWEEIYLYDPNPYVLIRLDIVFEKQP